MQAISNSDASIGAVISQSSRYVTFSNLLAVAGFGATAVGSALADAVMLGLIGFPLAVLGLLVSAAAAPGLVQPTERGPRRLLSRFLAIAAGAMAAVGAMACGFATAEALAHDHDNPWAHGLAASAFALGRHWLPWLAAPALGVAAVYAGRGRIGARGFVLASFWAAAAPAGLLVLTVLHAVGIIVFSA